MNGVGETGGMGYYEAQYDWVWPLIGFIAVTVLAIMGVNWILRKILRVERKKFFSNSSNFVNKRHEKVDAYFRWGGAAVSIGALFAFQEHRSFLPVIALFVISGIQGAYTMYMERTYADNPNDYKYSFLQFVTGTVIVGTCMVAFFPDFAEVMLDDIRLLAGLVN
ncbi:DUF4181 domain-containing protein [Planococcus sp. CP5-4]|uniref:DUF4181 domain-containing protein n=1 Tax=unclassified Planococcus (in: firmicutes) TaxID=2662419 RepID=UPI001C214F7A|nr:MULTISPECIES: DUF4181 domain-containing protein [unclassified Planococcus (in: firmicutes)]MBU9671914.1 DUF4181 domain-containing protein [Planococcus sp. CP5-4_YE]MBV0909234.1 DUF4181 domain-containing protein [Planococcus sp. CP5-4_UN]MBW6063726.1 DUF4181 domain-containing protein [Planococcus sp. CP5-4]